MKRVRKYIDPKHLKKIRLQLDTLNRAKTPRDMDVETWYFHGVSKGRNKRWAVWVDENWRITFGWGEHGPIDVDYEDYH